MEATTTRASTVIRSIPTRETRTHASMTMPLSSTRSRTSMRLVPPDVRSTGMAVRFLFASAPALRRSSGHGSTRGHLLFGELGDLALEDLDLFAERLVLR